MTTDPEQLLHRTKRHRTMAMPAHAQADGAFAPADTSPPHEIDSRAFAAAALDVLDRREPPTADAPPAAAFPPLPFPKIPIPYPASSPQSLAAAPPPTPCRCTCTCTIAPPNPPLPAHAAPAPPAPPLEPAPAPLSVPPNPPDPEEQESEGEAEQALALAADLAAVHLDKVEPALVPDVGAHPAAMQMSEGTMHSVATALQLTRAEIARRSLIDGGRSPTIAALESLEAFIAEVDGIPEGPDGPAPPPRRRPLFCVEATDPPAVRLPEPLTPPRDASSLTEESLLFARIEAAFSAADKLVPGRERERALEEAARYICCGPAVASSLVSTRSGRVRLRLLLSKTRTATGSLRIALSAVSALKAAVVKPAMERLRLRSWADADADEALGDCRRTLDVVEALRPSLRAAPCDLFLLPFADALHMLGLARRTAERAEGRPGGRAMLAEVLAAIGDQHALEVDLQGAIPLFFEAWSLAQEAGLSPSRLEARIILLLHESHMNDTMAFELAERMYWFTETDDDAVFEARARFALGRMAMVGAQLDEARQHFARVFEIARRLPREERAEVGVEIAALGQGGFAAIRAGRLYEGIMMWRDCLNLVDSAPDPASAFLVRPIHLFPDRSHLELTLPAPAQDIMTGMHRGFGRLASFATYISIFRLNLLCAAIFTRSSRSITVFHMVCALAELYARSGQRRQAALCFARAAAAAEVMPDVFPPEHPRCRRIRAALKELRAPSAGPDATPLPSGTDLDGTEGMRTSPSLLDLLGLDYEQEI
eukprot:tig00020806_g14038.t1